MSKGTTIKEALVKFEEKTKQKACECQEVKLLMQQPCIEKMDASLSTLTCCVKLSMSTNSIDKIANLNGLKHLKILSLGRNNIKSFTGLEAVGDSLEELWISYNLIEKLKGIQMLKKLKVLYMSNNAVKDVNEFSKLGDVPCLMELVFVGNPLQENWAPDAQPTYREFAAHKIKTLKKLDGEAILYDLDSQDD